jgi:hypothetical protein
MMAEDAAPTTIGKLQESSRLEPAARRNAGGWPAYTSCESEVFAGGGAVAEGPGGSGPYGCCGA